jgi:hypothetical protein
MFMLLSIYAVISFFTTAAFVFGTLMAFPGRAIYKDWQWWVCLLICVVFPFYAIYKMFFAD